MKKTQTKKEELQVPQPEQAPMVILPNIEPEPVKKQNFFMKMFAKKSKILSKSEEKKKTKIANDIKKLHSAKKKRFSVRNFSVRGFVKIINLQETLEKAGYEGKDSRELTRKMMRINSVILGFATLFFIVKAFIQGTNPLNTLLFLIAMWTGFFFLSLAVIWIAYLFYLDMKIYQRTKAVEQVFPDFLQLASSNISAGMPLDRALWYAVRPNFGVLAKEIETVAKNTLTGEDLAESLAEFAKKYDSKVIRRSVNLLLVGLSAGGELADLLNKIALNIEETRLLKRDMAANVTTYVIFITFASIVAAPALLGLSTQLLSVISEITSSIDVSGASSASSLFTASFSSDPQSVSNFRIFAYVMLTISSCFAAAIVNVIQHGNIKDGLNKFPIFIVTSLVIYTIANYLMSIMFAGFI